MMRQLIVVGASARAAAFSAIRAGFQPYAIDQFADHDLTAVCPTVRIKRYPHDFLAALREAPQAPWIYTGGLENYPRLVDRLAAIRPLWGNPGPVLRQVRDPFVLADVLREAGFQFPPTTRELTESTAHWMDRYSLRKPFRSCGGRRIEVVHGPQPATDHHYYQDYLRGLPWSAVFLAAGGSCRLLGVSRQIKGSFGEFSYVGSIVSPNEDRDASLEWMRMGSLLAARFELRGLFNIDLIWNSQGVWPLEVNPRYSASMEVLERATGLDFLALHAAAFDPTRTVPADKLSFLAPVKAYGKQIVYAKYDGVVGRQFERLVEECRGDRTWPAIADLPRAGDVIQKGRPICTVFAEGVRGNEVERQLQERAQHVCHALASDRGSRG